MGSCARQDDNQGIMTGAGITWILDDIKLARVNRSQSSM